MRDWLLWLIGVDPAGLGSGVETSLDLNSRLEGWQIFVAATAIVSFVWWVYKKDGRNTTSLPARVFLGVLRGTLILIAALILCAPILRLATIETRKSLVLLMVDDSYSMDLKYADAQEDLRKKIKTAMGGATVTLKNEEGKLETVAASKLEPRHFKLLSRLDSVSAALTDKTGGKDFLSAIREKHDLRILAFSRSVSTSDDAGKEIDPAKLASSQSRGMETRLGDCLRAALRESKGQPLAGIVLVTDGRQNAGEDAVQAAQACKTRNVPIFTIGAGDPSEPRDFELTFEGPEVILPDDQSEATAFVTYKGYTGIESVKVEMFDASQKVVATETATLGKPGEKTAVRMRFKESKPGKFSYTVKIPVQEGELRAENNTVAYNFQVVDKKVKILFAEGSDMPRWEYRYLKIALRRDHTTEVDVLIGSGENGFLWDGSEGKDPLEQFPTTKKEIEAYDLLLIGDASPDMFTKEQMLLVRDFVREGGGLMLIAGERYMPSSYSDPKSPWSEMLPVFAKSAAYRQEGGGEEPFGMEITPDGAAMSWTRLEQDPRENKEAWENLPKLSWHYPVAKKKELATTVLAHPFDKDDTGAKMPLVVTMPYGSGRVMYLGVDGLWRWRKGIGDRYHYRFYSQAARYLSMARRLGGQKRFFLGVDRNVAAIGDKLVFNALARDENHKEINDEKIFARGRAPDGTEFSTELTKLSGRPGHFEGGYFPTMEGVYTLWLRDNAQPDVHQSELNFRIEKPRLEFENPRLDEELLQAVSRAGGDGGFYVGLDGLRTVPEKIMPREERIIRETVIDIWDKWWLFLFFAAILTTEWLLRKRWKMI